MFVNEDYVIPQPFTSDQSGFSLVSHDRDEIIPESKLSLITVETKYVFHSFMYNIMFAMTMYVYVGLH